MLASVAEQVQSWEKSVYPVLEDTFKFLICEVLYNPNIKLQ